MSDMDFCILCGEGFEECMCDPEVRKKVLKKLGPIKKPRRKGERK